jgi:hypothetical protein
MRPPVRFHPSRRVSAVTRENESRLRPAEFNYGFASWAGWLFPTIGLCLLMEIGFVGLAGSVHGRARGFSMPEEQRKIELILSNQQGFDTALNVDYPGVRSLEGFRVIRPLVAILYNRSRHGIKAYVVKWVIVDARGRTQVRNLVPWAEAGGREALTGEEVVWNPGEPRLVSPRFNWGVSPFDVQDRTILMASLANDPLAAESAAARSINISVDAVIYDDGVFSGPDNGDFYDQYECERNGEQEEASLALSWLDSRLSDDDIAARLAADMEKGLVADGSDRNSLLDAARGREATRLLKAFKSGGSTGLRSLSVRVTTYKRAALRRM